jgi:hypothetical protein
MILRLEEFRPTPTIRLPSTQQGRWSAPTRWRSPASSATCSTTPPATPQRLGRHPNRSAAGIGLGLDIARRLARANRGDLRVTDHRTAAAHGSSCGCRWPPRPPAASPPAHLPAPASSRPAVASTPHCGDAQVEPPDTPPVGMPEAPAGGVGWLPLA